MRQLIVIGLTLAIFLPMSGIARPSAPEKDEGQKRSEAIARLKPGALVRIHAQSLGEIVGKYRSSNTDSLFISEDMGQRGVPIASIHALWVRGRATKFGAIIGGAGVAAIGLGLVIYVAVVVESSPSEPKFCSGGACGYALLAFGGGIAGGALVGAGLGTAFTKWHRRYRSPDYDTAVHSDLAEVEFADNGDHGERYSDVNFDESQPSRVRFSIVPDISRGGVNFSATFAF